MYVRVCVHIFLSNHLNQIYLSINLRIISVSSFIPFYLFLHLYIKYQITIREALLMEKPLSLRTSRSVHRSEICLIATFDSSSLLPYTLGSMEVKLPVILVMTDKPTDRPTNRRTDRRGHKKVSFAIIHNMKDEIKRELYNFGKRMHTSH